MKIPLTEILKSINPAQLDYQDWLAVGMALKHEGYQCADWDRWSMADFERYNPSVCSQKWATFNGTGTPITGGTIVELARQQGWEPPETRDEAYDWDLRTIYNPREDDDMVVPDLDYKLQDIEIEIPTEWDQVKEISTYLRTLYQPDEHVGYVVDSWVNDDGKRLPKTGSCSRTASELLRELENCKGDITNVFGDYDHEVGAWVRFNPLDGKGIKDENVTSYRYALVECDEWDVERQAALYKALELPIAILVHSGRRSLHAIVKIEAQDYKEYKERVDFLFKVLEKNGVEKKARANKNPSRLSRFPGFIRGEQKQFIVATDQGQSSFDEWKEWLAEQNDELPDIEPLTAVFDNLPPLAEPLIDGILRQGHKMLLAGPSKAGKSFLLLQLVIAIAEGRKWLDWQCTQGRVLYVNLELDTPSCLHRLKHLYTALGIPPKGLGNIDLWNLRGKAVPMDKLAPKLIRRAIKSRYSAVILDPIYKVLTGSENEAEDMARFCNQFDTICQSLGSSVIYCHHHSKGSQGQKSSRDRSSGSGVFARDPDAILDIIELVVPDQAKKQIINRAVCDRMADMLDTAYPDWRDKVSEDDALVSAKMVEETRRLLGPGADEIDETILTINTRVTNQSGWRLEGTLREFPPVKPIPFWFTHPVHSVDTTGILQDCKADGEEAPWQAERKAKSEAYKERTESGKERVIRAFNDWMFENEEPPMIGDIADTIGVTEKDIRAWLKKTNTHIVCKDGTIRTQTQAKNLWVTEAIQKATDITGHCPLTDVAKHMNKSVKTARRNVDDHPDYEVIDGKVVHK